MRGKANWRLSERSWRRVLCSRKRPEVRPQRGQRPRPEFLQQGPNVTRHHNDRRAPPTSLKCPRFFHRPPRPRASSRVHHPGRREEPLHRPGRLAARRHGEAPATLGAAALQPDLIADEECQRRRREEDGEHDRDRKEDAHRGGDHAASVTRRANSQPRRVRNGPPGRPQGGRSPPVRRLLVVQNAERPEQHRDAAVSGVGKQERDEGQHASTRDEHDDDRPAARLGPFQHRGHRESDRIGG